VLGDWLEVVVLNNLEIIIEIVDMSFDAQNSLSITMLLGEAGFKKSGFSK